MSVTSHAFHILKDIQTFAAACVALVAAVIAYASQRYAADTQATSARENTRIQVMSQKRKDEQAILVGRLAFAAKLFICNQKAANELSVLKIQLRAIENKGTDDGVVELPNHPLWSSVVAFLKLSQIYDFEAMLDKGFAISDQNMQRAFIDTTSTLRRWDIGFAMIVEASSRSEVVQLSTLGVVVKQIDETINRLNKSSVEIKYSMKTLQQQAVDTAA